MDKCKMGILRCIAKLLLLVLLAQHTNGVLSKRTCHYISGLIATYKGGHGHSCSSYVIPPPIPAIGDSEVNIEDFFLPPVILWNPLLIYPRIVPPGSIECSDCGKLMHEGYWNDGSSADRQPRVLQGIDNVVLLVSAVYVCDNRHKLLAHDKTVLDKFPTSNIIPFLLLHRTGFTRDLVDMCTSVCRRGINFYNLESIIMERRWELFTRRQEMLQIHCKLTQQNVHLHSFWTSPESKSPSNDVLSKCFVAEFLRQEQLYLKEMINIPPGESISFDHTFKVAANIGYLREDGKWICEYDGLFIVLNEDGKVISWQLTKGTSFAHIKDLLQQIVQRPHQDQSIKTVYIDDCCKLRSKIKSVLGAHVTVKLDLFHAVQRITKTLSKKHPLMQQCMKELRCVFRCDGDSGEKRLSDTPPPDVILSKLDTFSAKWKDRADDKGMILFKSDTLDALNNIKRHISAGCLSGIPPGGGTNRNERLHKHINSYFNRSRIGILLAYALLTIIFYSHNSSKKFAGKLVVQPVIAASSKSLHLIDIKPIGITPKQHVKQQDIQKSDHWEMDKSDRISSVEYVCSIIRPIYCTSIKKFQISASLVKMELTQMSKSVKYFQEFTSSIVSNGFGESDIQSRLSEYGLILNPVTKDGNCFFHSIALNITSNLERWNNCLTRIGVEGDVEIGSLCMKLRQVFVHEILGDRRQMYECFNASDLDYPKEATKFLQSGFFASSLGDLMPLAMATALQVSILIITTTPSSQPIYVTPQDGSIEGIIILVYEPTGSGHYDAAIPYCDTMRQTNMSVSTKSECVSCRCGVNKKSSGKVCSHSALYASRCKCYLKSQPCTSKCCCKGCENPYGVHVPKPRVGKRSRHPHMFQMDIPTSKKFALERGESLSTGIWSVFESIVLDEVVSYHKKDSTIDIVSTYNDIVYYSNSAFCAIPLQDGTVFRQKTSEQIHSRINFAKKV